MKKLLLLFIPLLFLSCVTIEKKHEWAKELGYTMVTEELTIRWARELGFILPSEVITPDGPTHDLLPHPVLPILDTENITMKSLMEQVILLSASIEKLSYLVEIYEREYVDTSIEYSNERFKDMNIVQLKIAYLNLLGVGSATTR